MHSLTVIVVLFSISIITIYSFQIRNSHFNNYKVRLLSNYKMSLKIQVNRNPNDEYLAKLGCKKWPTWGCKISKFPWTYETTEQSYITKGKVIVTSNDGESVTIEAGDFVVFPEGLSCTWNVIEPIEKHYNFN